MKVIEMPLHSYQAIRDLKVDIDLEKNIIVFGDKGMTVIKDPDSEIIDGRLFNGGHCAIAVVQCPNEIHLYLINSKAHMVGVNIIKSTINNNLVKVNAHRPIECLFRHICFELLFNTNLDNQLFKYGSRCRAKFGFLLSHLLFHSNDMIDSYTGTYNGATVTINKDELTVYKEDIIFQSKRIHKLQKTHFK
jgi:hypothetical protein